MPIRTIELDTPVGPGRVSIHGAAAPVGTLLLGHGAGGQGWSADLRAVTAAAVDAGWSVGLLDQPWRVAGRKVAPAPATLDKAWVPMVKALLSGRSALPRPLVVGGRSAGARVACRTANALGAVGVLAVSFPLHPPGRPGSSRADELTMPLMEGLALRVIQGAADPFGTPGEVVSELPDPAYVTAVPGTHSVDAASVQVAVAALSWLEQLG